MLALVLLSLVGIGLVILIMSVGVIFQGRCLRGSCGGPEILDADGVDLACATCPLRKKQEAEQTAA